MTSLAEAPISGSSRLLLAHQTDGTDSGTEFRDGRRRKEVPATRRDGRLAFKADVSIRPDDATIFYELTCD